VKMGPDGNIYVVDSGNGRVEELDTTGNFILEFGKSGPASDHLNSPIGLAIDGAGNFYVTDNGNARVVKYSL